MATPPGPALRGKHVTAVDRSKPGLGYSLAAILISCGVAAYEYIKWLSIVGHYTNWPFVLRGAAAFSLGVWAGSMAKPPRSRALQFAAFEVPQLLLINSWSILPLVATSRDPAVWPFFLAISGMNLGDLVFWATGVAAAAKLVRSRGPGPSRELPGADSSNS
jgi:hypothetical protein